MTEKKLSRSGPKLLGLPWYGLAAATVALVLGAAWLSRVAFLENWARGLCAGQKLNCNFKVTRLDFGGITLDNLAVSNLAGDATPVTAKSIKVDLAWNWLSPRPSLVGAQDAVINLNLSGKGPLAGDLDQLIQQFMKPGKKPTGPPPNYDLRNVQLVAQTPIGPITGRGHLVTTSLDDFDLDLVLTPVKLANQLGALDLAAAKIVAKSDDGKLVGDIDIDLRDLKAPAASVQNLKLAIDLAQADGRLIASGTAKLGEFTVNGAGLTNVDAKLGLEADPIDVATVTTEKFLTGIRKLALEGVTGGGDVNGATWTSAKVSAAIDPREGGGAGGPIRIEAKGVRHPSAIAEQLVINGDVVLPQPVPGKARTLSASGRATLENGKLTNRVQDALARALSGPVGGVLPGHGEATANATRNATTNADISLPWKIDLDGGGMELSALSGAALKAANGFSGALTGETNAPVLTYSTREDGGLRGAGRLRISGGGGPPLTLDYGDLRLSSAGFTLQGRAQLDPWKAGGDTLSGVVSNLSILSANNAGVVAGDARLQLTGKAVGASFRDLVATTGVRATWSADATRIDTPRNLQLAWKEASLGDTKIGPAQISYAPQGPFAASTGPGALAGRGRVSPVNATLAGGGLDGAVKLNAVDLRWSSGATTTLAFDIAAPAGSLMPKAKDGVAVSLKTLRGQASAKGDWKLTGNFGGGDARASNVAITDMAGGFALASDKAGLSGAITKASARILDPQPDETRRFEPVLFAGDGKLAGDVVTFSGKLALAAGQRHIANVVGVHDLGTGEGRLDMPAGTVTFQSLLQPPALSPLLRGPANVAGTVGVAGAALWGGEKGFRANARVSLSDVGFTLAGAGVFEDVHGVVVLDDLFGLTSPPHQKVAIGKVTLGLPIENGVIDFQLLGPQAIRLERAEWPFVGGFIRVKPTDFTYAAKENRIVAQAVDWDLATIIELFKVPDVKATGTMNGDFPVVFSTGSARIDKAVLQASQDGGVIRYTGDTAAAASQADPNSKLLFDALKDFRFKVLKMGLDGDIAGKILVSLGLEGNNPAVAGGQAFALNIGIDSALMQLLNITNQGTIDREALQGGKIEIVP